MNSNTVTLISCSSGFGNIPNTVIPLHTYNHSAASERNNTGWDRCLGTFALPEGCVAVSDEYETNVLSPSNNICSFGEEKDGTVWIAWTDDDRRSHFHILTKTKKPR